MVRPSSPRAPSRLMMPRSTGSARSRSAAYGTISRSVKSAASRRSAACSSSSERSMDWIALPFLAGLPTQKLAVLVLVDCNSPHARPGRARYVTMARPRSPLLSHERIVVAAIALVDAEGLAALSTRRLATQLGVSGPSLYNHFATKDDLLEAMADAVTAQVDISSLGARPWPQALRAWATSYRRTLAEHPNLVPVIAHGPARRPHALRLAAAVYGAPGAAVRPP